MKQNTHITPEGYFSSLKSRLHEIPVAQEANVPVWQRVRPHLALAAAFLALVTAGTAILRSTAGDPVAAASADSVSQYELAQLVRTSAPYMYDEESFEAEEEEFSEDDIIEYLIESGVSIENLEENENEN